MKWLEFKWCVTTVCSSSSLLPSTSNSSQVVFVHVKQLKQFVSGNFSSVLSSFSTHLYLGDTQILIMHQVDPIPILYSNGGGDKAMECLFVYFICH